MRAIKSMRHQYFSFLIRQAVIFLFDEARERCFVFARLPFLSYVNSGSQKTRPTGSWKSGLLVDDELWEITWSSLAKVCCLNSSCRLCHIYDTLSLVFVMLAACPIIFGLIEFLTFGLNGTKAAGHWWSGSLWVWEMTAAANQSKADVSKWALNTVCCPPALGASH